MTKKSKNSNTLSPVKVADSYTIQKIENSNTTYGKPNIKVYFDTKDVVDILQGLWAFENFQNL